MLESGSSEVIREAVLGGLGIAMRSHWDVSRELDDGRLRQVLPAYIGAADVSVYVVYPSRRLVPVKVRRFVDHLIKHFETAKA